MQLGYFDPASREYVLTDPRTPVKWINYIGTRAFGGFIDHTGGALLCRDDPTYNRITRYVQPMPASDFKATTVYLRLHGPHGFRLFAPFFLPTLDPLERFECHVGLGYNRWISEHLAWRSEITVFVPPGECVQVTDIRVTRLADPPESIDVIPLVEYSHPDAMMQFTNADWLPQTMQSRAVPDGDRLILLQYPFMNRDRQVNYLTSSLPPSSFDTERKAFLGQNEYGTFRDPFALQQPELSNSEANRGDNVGALLHPLGPLARGESRRLTVLLGQAPSLQAALPIIQRFRQPTEVDAALDRLRLFWDGYLQAFQTETPDRLMNTMLNVHNPYQCFVTKTWSRYLSMYQPGLGARGIGYRDSMQDLMGVFPAAADEGKPFLCTLLSFQRPDGPAVHQYNPLTLQGSQGDSLELADRPHYYSDDHLWGVLAVCAYVKETGNLAFPKEQVPFVDRTSRPSAHEGGSVLEHLRRGLDFTRKDIGAHGLPLLGFADWNDTVNLPRGAESVFAAQLYGKALLEVIALLEHLGDRGTAEVYRAAYEEMRSRVEASAWDGDWYVQYFDQNGEPLGSRSNRYARIQLNAQSWAVISGFASQARARRAMDSAHDQLNTRFGLKLSTPGYDGYDPALGGVSTYPPGAKENGGIFLHPNPWAMIAECLLGNGDRAYEYYAQINPASKNGAIEVYECEPYVYAQNILGDEHPQFGLARNSWLTGTASWCYQAATQWILGIRPEYAGLQIDPCIPSGWDGYQAARRFRGRTYHISVHNPEHVCRGATRIELDGQGFSGIRIPPDLPGESHQVEVWLGRGQR
jgi:cellobiose phosphorylase